MKTNKNRPITSSLRQRAEELMSRKGSKTNLQLPEEDLIKLIHELEVHQIELELQNKELLQARATAQTMADKYFELYEFAPIGYLTLSEKGAVNELNPYAAKMLGKDRSQLKDSQFAFFISDDTKPIFEHFFNKVFLNNVKEICEVILISDSKPNSYVQLTGIVNLHCKQCFLTIMDITDQKHAEAELDKWVKIFKPKAN